MAVDGSLIFNTLMDITGFKKGANEITSKTVEIKNKISQTEREIQKLSSELKEMADTPIKSSITEKLEKDVERTKTQLKSLYAEADRIGDSKQAELTSMGFDSSHLDSVLSRDKEWQKVQEKISLAEATLEQYEKELNSVKAAEAKVTSKDTAEYRQKQEKLQQLVEGQEVYKAKLREAQQSEQKASSQTKKSTNTFKKLSEALKDVSARLGQVCKKAVANTLKSLAGHMKNLVTHTKKTNSQMSLFNKSLNRIKQALSGLLLYKVLQGGLNALKEGIENLAKACPKVNTSISALMTSLTYLKNTLSAAFAPIINIATPILTGFIDTLSAVTEKVGNFIAVLSGQSSYIKAIKVQQDYAASLDSTTQSTEKNTKAAQDNQKNLAAYDELNVMQQDSDTATANAGTENYFTEVPTVFSSFADQLKKAFEKGNYRALGQVIADNLNKAMSSVKWNKIRSTAKKWASSIAGFLNGAVEKLDWFLTGTTIAEGINTAIEFTDSLIGVNGINFKKIGEGIAKSLNGLFKNLNTKKLGKVLADVINAIINYADGFAYIFDWKNLGITIHDTLTSFFGSINVDGAIQAFINTINGVVTSAIYFIGTPDFYQWGINITNGIIEAIQGINWADISTLFSTLVLGALNFTNGILDGINWEEFGNSIANSFNNFFSEDGDGYIIISSMVTNFSNLIWGLFTSLDNIINCVNWGSLGENLATVLTDFVDPYKDKSWIDLLSKTASDIVKALLDFINGVFEKQETANTFADGFSSMLNNIDWEGIFIKAMSVLFNLKSWIADLAYNLVENFCLGLATGFTNAENDNGVNEAVKGFVKAIGNSAITIVEGLLKLLANAIPNFVVGLVKTILGAFAEIGRVFLGEDWYNNATEGLWGENSFKFDFPIELPRLATGAYVPANYGEFLAVLGDNKREPEVVSPVSAMKQAFLEALAESGYNGGRTGDINVTVVLPDGSMLKAVGIEDDRYKKRYGHSRFA